MKARTLVLMLSICLIGFTGFGTTTDLTDNSTTVVCDQLTTPDFVVNVTPEAIDFTANQSFHFVAFLSHPCNYSVVVPEDPLIVHQDTDVGITVKQTSYLNEHFTPDIYTYKRPGDLQTSSRFNDNYKPPIT